jgi:hypothetical protein
MLKSLRDHVRGYKLISGTGHGGHGWDFPNGIREMDLMMVERGMAEATEHETRVEVILAYSHAFERENPDLDMSDITARMWAMMTFILCHAAMHEESFAGASTIAAQYGLKWGQSTTVIEWCCDWALQQTMARRLRQR